MSCWLCEGTGRNPLDADLPCLVCANRGRHISDLLVALPEIGGTPEKLDEEPPDEPRNL